MLKKSLQTIFALCLACSAIKAQCPSPDAGADQTVCVGSTVTLIGILPSNIAGTWTKVGGFFAPAGVITNTASPTSTVTGLNGAETLSLVWTLNDGASCVNLRDTVIIHVNASPTSTNAGTDKTVCAGGTATLAATVAPAGSIGTWTKLNGINSSTTVIANINDYKSTVTGLNSLGTDTLKWTVNNADCGGTAFDIMVIKVNAAPSVAHVISTVLQKCQHDTIQLVGNTPTVGTPSWALPTNSGAAFITGNGSPNNDTVSVRGVTAGGKISMAYRISNGTGATILNGCLSVDTAVISFNPSVAHAGPDQKLCTSGAGSITLAATPVAVGEIGTWSLVKNAGNEAITDVTSFSTTVTAITSDTVTLRWTVTGGGCSNSDDINIITLGAAPSTAVAGPHVTSGCVGDTILLNGNIATSGTPSWTRTKTDVAAFNFTCFCSQFNDPFIPANGDSTSIKVALLKAGTYKFYYTISVGTSTITGTCTSIDSSTVIVNAKATATIVTPPPVGFTPSSPNQTSCTATTFTVTARHPTTGTGVWSIVAPGTGHIAVNDTVGIVTGLAQGVTTLAWTVNNGICPIPAVSKMTISSGPPSSAVVGSDLSGCKGDTIKLIGSVANFGSPVWSVVTPPTTGFNFFTPTPVKFVPNATNDTVKAVLDSVGTYKLYYTISNGTAIVGSACTSRDSMLISITKCITGINENTNGGLIVSIQPNPASGWFNLSLKDSKTSFAEVSILALDGRTVVLEQLGSVKDIVKIINISNLSDGIYFVKIKKGDEIYTTKLVVQ